MSSRQASAMVFVISSPWLPPSGFTMLVLKSPATSSTALWENWLMAVTPRSIVAALSVARYQPTINHRRLLEATWKLSTFGPCFCIASTWKWGHHTGRRLPPLCCESFHLQIRNQSHCLWMTHKLKLKYICLLLHYVSFLINYPLQTVKNL